MWDSCIYNGALLPMDGKGLRKRGYIGVQDGCVVAIGEGTPPVRAALELDAGGMYILPALADCHTHLMEYAVGEVYQAQGPAQGMAGLANWMQALAHGIVTLGEHHLGHPVLSQPMETYLDLAEQAPMEIYLAFGECILGMEPLARTAATTPGQGRSAPPTAEEWALMAQAGSFPGENLFLNATVANLPAHLAPNAGRPTYAPEALREIVEIFHRHKKRIGAHIEGPESAAAFLEAGGDVICHGHALPRDFGKELARRNAALVATPHAGTSSRPTSPEELWQMREDGVLIAIASDSYIPVHPEADWYALPQGYVVGPQDLARVAQPVCRYFLEQGASVEDAYAMLSRHAYAILDPAQPLAGTLLPGAPAHLLVSPGIPGVDLEDLAQVRQVWWRGQLVINRMPQ